jgi:putative transposase
MLQEILGYRLSIVAMNTFWRAYYHLVWGTKNRLPLITIERELLLYPYIRSQTDELGCILHAIGGISNHIHLVVSIPPTISAADFVKRIKGSTAYYLNHQPGHDEQKFIWQRGYSFFTMGEQQSPRAIAYVLNQKQHHQENSVIASLEFFPEDTGRSNCST